MGYRPVRLFWPLLCAIVLSAVNSSRTGPEVIATKGAVWPKPQQQNSSDNYFVLKPQKFMFKVLQNKTCDFLLSSLKRYWNIIQGNVEILDNQRRHHPDRYNKKSWLNDDAFSGYLDHLNINFGEKCPDDPYPGADMDESYHLYVQENKFQLDAATIWGILRGLETFSQIVYVGDDGLTLQVNSTEIVDSPRYKHRGLLIDTSRHFLPIKSIYKTLDAMSYNKMNVLHWHIVDDQSFPYVSLKYPELSDMGAYNKYTKVYYPEDVKSVIEYAKMRGIRVVVEFDTPGHTASWGLSHPEILTECQIFHTIGPMDPSKNETYALMTDLFTEIKDLFKDKYVHLGGDEVDFTCWMANVDINNFMEKNNISTYEKLEGYYIQKIVDLTDSLELNSIVWEEVFTNGVKLPNDTVVHVWRGDWTTTMKKVTEAGQPALLSSCWYLDHLSSGGDWMDFYYCDPTDFKGTEQEQLLVMGGEACMWGEVVNEYNIISRVWPRASATAEKLWSPYMKIDNEDDMNDAARRLEEHTCRMNRRGIEAQPPNGAGYCD
ncbi:beta-hexosaminidase subunit beta-like [Rhynchophorus ferrugineus]|uniref:beta-hexosaminidase subunit beta-like n=1 Tax=Rhynchophorus ferrugineus TaxID=354439 RepID=UPI003FCEA4E0